MLNCMYCGSELPANARFCGKCGRVQEVKAERATAFSPIHQDSQAVPQQVAPVVPVMLLPIGGQMPAGAAPMIQGSPQIGGVPAVQGSPQVGGTSGMPAPSAAAQSAPPPQVPASSVQAPHQAGWQAHNAPVSAAQHAGNVARHVAIHKMHVPILRTAVSKAIAASVATIVVAAVVVASLHRTQPPPRSPIQPLVGPPVFISATSNVLALRFDNGQQIWKVPTQAGGQSAPLEVNGVIYSTTDTSSSNGKATNSYVYALKASNGTLFWKYQFPNGVYISHPAISNGVVFVDGSDFLYALRANDGSLLWKTGPAYNGTLDNTPFIANGVIYIDDSLVSTLYAVRASDGAHLWTISLDALQFAFADGTLYASVSPPGGFSSIAAVRPADGHVLWTYQTKANSLTSGYPYIVSANGVIYALVRAGNSGTETDVYAVRASDGTGLWTAKVGTHDVTYFNGGYAPLIVANGIVYAPGDAGQVRALYALRASDGTQLWTFPLNGTQAGTAWDGFAVQDGQVYLNNGNGTAYALRADNGKQVWQNTSLGYNADAPLEQNGIVFFTGSDNQGGVALFALHASNGSQVWQTSVDPLPLGGVSLGS